MQIELAHDIIALKVWDFLPEQDKRLRLIKNSLGQRLKDYDSGTGSLLGERELLAWEDYLDLLNLNKQQQQFIDASNAAIIAEQAAKKEQEQRELRLVQQKLKVEKKARRKQLFFSIGLAILAGFALIASFLAIQSQNLAKKKQAEAERVAKEMGRAMQDLTQKRGDETLDLIKFAESQYDFESSYQHAQDLTDVLSNNEKRIAQFAASNDTIVSEFKAAITPLKNQANAFLTLYQPLINSGKAEDVKTIMQKIDGIIQNKNFEAALKLHREVKSLNVDFLNTTLIKKEQEIKQKAYTHYIALANNGFKQNQSPRAKLINPYRWVQIAESYHNGSTAATIELKEKICEAVLLEANNISLSDLLTIKAACE